MAQAYGDDLRRKFLTAYDQGEETLRELSKPLSGQRENRREGIGSTESHRAG